ncbi:uncharacterized protein G2W53_028619 [Senna tora]|uniref:Uncharacterized protein n=1 Tax=Senna tora TaxID=362788 RepID=A0A834T4J6_9FABA|nr:uncharacterized protein G2W53_028619 [Senna tora]
MTGEEGADVGAGKNEVHGCNSVCKPSLLSSLRPVMLIASNGNNHMLPSMRDSGLLLAS